LSLTIPGRTAEPARVFGQLVSTNFFTRLGVAPADGAWFDADERAAAIVVSDRFRRTWLGSSAIGRTVHLNGAPFVVSGVLPPAFRGASVVEADVWLPLHAATTAHLVDRRMFDDRRSGWLIIGGRLKPGMPLAAANAELNALAIDLEREYTASGARMTLSAAPSSLLPGNRGVAAVLLGILMILTSLVLLVACTNVTGVLLARADARRHEMAVRLSIGAGRARLIRQLLVETSILFALGGVAGLAVARGMVRAVVAALPALPVPIAVDLPLDLRVIAFTTGVAAITALASGLVPALRASKAAPVLALKNESSGPAPRSRLRSLFVAGQSTISVALVFIAVLFTRALIFAGSTDPGYDPRGVEMVSIDLSMGGDGTPAHLPFWRSLVERVRQLPGVESATVALGLPGGFETMGVAVAPPGAPVWTDLETFEPDGNIIAPGYFKTMGIPMAAGRDFTADDRAGATPVVIVGEAAARHYWPGRSAIGQYLEHTTPQGKQLLLVVGVARDVRSSTVIDGVASSTIYFPLEQDQSPFTSRMTIVARASGGRPIAGDIRAIVTAMNPNLPIATTETLRDRVAIGLLPQRIVAVVTASLGLASALLAAIGIYGISSFAVSRRTREFGIRMALGAGRASILTMVLRQGMLLSLVGAALGLALGTGAGRVLASFLFGIPPLDPLALIGTAIVFTAVGAAASYGPARRATTVDPIAALKYE
jgi:predicted permease